MDISLTEYHCIVTSCVRHYIEIFGLDSNQLDQNVYQNLFHVFPQSSDKQMMEYKGVNSASHQKVPHENENYTIKSCPKACFACAYME